MVRQLFFVGISLLILSLLVNMNHLSASNATLNETSELENSLTPETEKSNILNLGEFDTIYKSVLFGPGSEKIKSPFKSCVIYPFSKAFSNTAIYDIRGQAKTWDSESTNYALRNGITINLNYNENKLTGSISSGNFSAQINTNEITTTCINDKDLSIISAPSSIIIPPQSHNINPPLNSCLSNSNIQYSIYGTFNNIKDKDIIKINNPNDMYFDLQFNSYFKEANLDANLYMYPLSDSFEVKHITTNCVFK